MKSAVLFIVFNRPDTTRLVFEAIRAAKPTRLYVAADGFRADRPGEKELCEQVRQISTDVDWPCEILTLFRDHNLGCKMGVSTAIDWFFSHEEEGIILEDDVLPLPGFFAFCDELLEKYRFNENVTMITGCNLVTKRYRPSPSYFFSRYCHIWGWATWRRAWLHYDVTMKSWPDWDAKGNLSSTMRADLNIEQYWRNIFSAVYAGNIDTWDYQWVFSCWKHGGLSILPENNLIQNIGFGIDATHTTMAVPKCLVESVPKDLDYPLVHPKDIRRAQTADKIIERHVFGFRQ